MLVRQRSGATIDARIVDVRSVRPKIESVRRVASDVQVGGRSSTAGGHWIMHSVPHMPFSQLMSGMMAVSPSGFWSRHVWMHMLSAQLATQRLNATQAVLSAHAWISLQHFESRHVVHAVSPGMAGQLPGGPPPPPVVVLVPPPLVVLLPLEPPLPPSSDPPLLLVELQ
jgi:hypothetical protein